MASIDKTYTSSYVDYVEFKDWANKQIVTFFNGHKGCIGDYVWDYNEDDFSNGEIPIMNTPTWVDIYLIQNCNIGFIINRMKFAYGKSFDELKANCDPFGIPDDYKQNRKIVIKCIAGRTKYPIHSAPYGGKMNWWLQCSDWRFCTESLTWTSNDTNYPSGSNTAHVSSIKALVRLLRKQCLPKGLEFNLIGRYIGEDYLIKIK